MRIQSIQVNGFKSLIDFRLDLAKFSCLVGINGVGKSTVLQFIDFLAQQVRGDLGNWFQERGWDPKEVRSRLGGIRAITFEVQISDVAEGEITWTGTYNPEKLHCTTEKISTGKATLSVKSGRYSITNLHDLHRPSSEASLTIPFTYEGSILSQLRDKVLPTSIANFRRFFLGTESLDMLTPERLRRRTRDAHGSLGHGGRNLSAFVYELGPSGRRQLAGVLKKAYTQLSHVYAKQLRSGWKQLQISEMFGNKKLWTEARHVNDGLLRLIAIFSELSSKHGLLLFDEIENGINPELVEFVTDALVQAPQQIVITTHSPMILNFLQDDVAKSGIIYLYKTSAGHTKALPFFSIPSLAKKLKYMGPGEAFADTNLTELSKEIGRLKGAK